MENHLALIRGDDLCESQWDRRCYFKGSRVSRRIHLYINGIKFQTYMDHNPATGNKVGAGLDQIIEADVALLEEALKCRCIRGEMKGRIKLIPDGKNR